MSATSPITISSITAVSTHLDYDRTASLSSGREPPLEATDSIDPLEIPQDNQRDEEKGAFLETLVMALQNYSSEEKKPVVREVDSVARYQDYYLLHSMK